MKRIVSILLLTIAVVTAGAQNMKVLQFRLLENDLTEEITDSGKVSYKEQVRETLDRKRLEADLGDLTEYIKTTAYNVFRLK